jgi:NADH dehydrogenase FAD-containing subunit
MAGQRIVVVGGGFGGAAAARTVTTPERTLEYDHLVVAAGAAYDWDAVPRVA